MRQSKGRNAAALMAAAAGAVAASLTAPARAGQTNNQITISLSGSTAMRNFTTSPGLTLVQPETQLTLSNGTNAGTTSYPGSLSYWTNGGLLYQLAPKIAGQTVTDGFTNQSDVLRVEWHEQGSVEGILDLINDQIAPVAGNAGTRNPTGANPIWVNQNRFVDQNPINGYTLGAFGTAQGQSKVQMAISDVNAAQGFASGAAGAAAWNKAPTQAGYGRGNQALVGGGPTNLANFGNAGGRVELVDGAVANMSGTLAGGGSAPTNGAWTTAGVGNLENRAVAVTATLFVANPGTGLDKLNRTDAQWLQTTGRFSNGAAFNMTTRDVNSGTRNVAANNTGVDPSWAVGVNDGGLGTSAENAIGASLKFSNKTAGGNLRTTVANARMAVGTLGLSDALANSVNNSSAPLRGLDYANSADGASGYVRASAASITDGSYAIWHNETYVTVKAPDAQYANTNGANILGDTLNADVRKVRDNVLNSSRVYTGTNLAQYFAPADALVANGFLPTQLVKVAKTFDGTNTASNNPNYLGDPARQDFLDDASRASKFAVGGTGADTSPTNVTSGTSSFYNDGSQTGTNAIAITAYNNANGLNAGGNYLFGNFNQKGTRDFAALQSARAAQAALFASGRGVNIASGSNAVVVSTGVAALDAMQGQQGGGTLAAGATKGDLIAMGDFNGDGRFDGKDLYQFATGAALADSTNSTTLTPVGGETLGDALRRGVLVKNAALDYLQANATAQQKVDASANLVNDPTGANAFNKLDVNRDGRVSRNDGAIVDRFLNVNKNDLTAQLAATINVDGSLNPVGAQRVISLYQVGLIDGRAVIGKNDFALVRSRLSMTNAAGLGQRLGDGDTNFDGKVDFSDIQQILANGRYNQVGGTPTRWAEGDYNGDGKVDFSDIQSILATGLYNAGNYDGNAAPGPVADAVAAARVAHPLSDGGPQAASTVGAPNDGKATIVYDPSTGRILVETDGLHVNSIDVKSVAGLFTHPPTASNHPQPNNPDNVESTFSTRTANEVAYGLIGSGVWFTDYDYGNLMDAGVSLATLLNDLTITYTVDGVAGAFTGDVRATPEPATLSLAVASGAALLARRRRRHAPARRR